MKKTIITIIFIVMSIFFITPVNAKAISVSNSVNTNNIYILDKTEIVIDDEINNCTGEEDNSILGNVQDENSVAWLVNEVLNYVKVLGPILVVILSSIDFIKVIIKSDDEAMAKAQKKLIMRLILALLLFLIPSIVQTLLGVFGISSNCVIG